MFNTLLIKLKYYKKMCNNLWNASDAMCLMTNSFLIRVKISLSRYNDINYTYQYYQHNA